MSGLLPTARNGLKTVAQSYVTVVVVALLVGAAIAPVAWGATSSPDGTVAVIEMDQSITEPVAEGVTDDLREARENESIDAVVLQVDSPGGGVTASESLYLSVERTAEQLPVVTNVQSQGASGGYYMAAPSDKIYVNPSSVVGSVGVRGTYLDQAVPDEEITTGPDKSGATEERTKQQLEAIKQTFVGSVMEHRGDELELTETELAYAKTYTGTESVDNGLADGIGDTDVAVGTAAELAGLEDYDTVTMERDSAAQQMLLIEDGEPAEGPNVHPQTFGDYGDVTTPAYLALWGSVDGETVIATSQPSEPGGDADGAPAATAGTNADADADEPTAAKGGETR